GLIRRSEQAAGPCSVEWVRRDAGAQPKRESGLCEPGGDQVANPGRESRGSIGTCAQKHDDELVPSETCHLRAGLDRGREDLPHLVEQSVSELVSCTVVDLLEVVAVEDEQAQRDASLLGLRQPALEALLETAPV